MPVTPNIVIGDILDQEVEVIVNAWNRNWLPWWLVSPRGVSGAIKRAAGTGPFRELSRLGPLPLGKAVMTSPGRLPFKAIIHVAGINLLWVATERSIRASVLSAMDLVKQHAFSSVAFPLIGAGTGGFPPARVREMMVEELATIESQCAVTVVEYWQP